ncbi:hypothetical protein KUCAC02_016725, partial [Chaenocephalus aceratus]
MSEFWKMTPLETHVVPRVSKSNLFYPFRSVKSGRSELLSLPSYSQAKMSATISVAEWRSDAEEDEAASPDGLTRGQAPPPTCAIDRSVSAALLGLAGWHGVPSG